ncbi:DUF6541 family protein [Microbacterium sp. CJ88]|uniref:DUF6541 family protein n=1 Tax=Microbacterium sp. CJ88 TaxID=3445672 RepID=UPI003F65E2C1
MEWLAQTPALVVAALTLFLPGLVVGGILRLRGLTLWAVAPVISITALTAAATVLGLAGAPWRPWSAAVGVVVAVALAVAVRVAIVPDAAPRARADGHRWMLVAGVVSGVILTALRVGLYIGSPSAISQTNDALFHLNAVRFAAETGAASPLQLTSMIGAGSFYPSAWHVVASLVVQFTGTSVEVAANATSVAVAALAWPLGVAVLTRAVAGSRAAAIATVAAAAIPAFPLLMLQWGVLYPQLVAVAVLPASIAVVVMASELAAGRRASWVRPVLLVAAGVAALVFAQPSVLLAWVVAVVAIAFFAVLRSWKGSGPRARILSAGALVAGAAGATVLWYLFGRSIAGTWPPSTSLPVAAVEVLANGYLGYPWAVGVSILSLIGLVVAVRAPRQRWIALTWAILALLYVVSAAVGSPLVRAFLVDPWYDDPYRLAAMMPVVVLPLAGIGASSVIGWASAALGTSVRRTAAVAAGVVIVVGAASLVVAPEIQRRDVFAHRIDPNLYRVTADSFLSADELAVLERLDQTVPADGVVIGNPGTGMAFGYAISGRNVVPRTWSPPPSGEFGVLWTSLRDVAADPAVCAALDAFGARYVLDFGPGEEYPGRWLMPGFDRLDGQPGFTLLDRQGAATLWYVTACD